MGFHPVRETSSVSNRSNYVSEYKARYSGPGRTGICVCGHKWDRHHLGIIMQPGVAEAIGEGYVPQECEFFGCNEAGGLMPVTDSDGSVDWVPHCSSYRDSGEI